MRSRIIRDEYPGPRAVEGIRALLAKHKDTPIGLTWTGGIAITYNDYRHAEKLYALFQTDRPAYEHARHTRGPTFDPIQPVAHLGPLLGWRSSGHAAPRRAHDSTCSVCTNQAAWLEAEESVAKLLNSARSRLRGPAMEWDQASPVLRRVLELDPDNLEALELLGTLLFRTDRRSEAVTLYERMVAAGGDPALLHWGRAVVLSKAGKTQDAIDSYSRYIELRPDESGAYVFRSRLRLALGDEEGAIADMVLAVEKAPHETRAKYLRRDLQALKQRLGRPQ